jgi:hypothetical protein
MAAALLHPPKPGKAVNPTHTAKTERPYMPSSVREFISAHQAGCPRIEFKLSALPQIGGTLGLTLPTRTSERHDGDMNPGCDESRDSSERMPRLP